MLELSLAKYNDENFTDFGFSCSDSHTSLMCVCGTFITLFLQYFNSVHFTLFIRA